MQSSSVVDRSLPAVLGWGAFLGISWTWCIGMFLPVLLIRDYGFGGWLVFALPNVIGAAAMGTVLAAPGASRRMIQPHRAAGIVFSIVTISFHAFVVGWVGRGLIGPIAIPITAVAAIVFYFAGRRGRRDLITAAVLLVLSTLAFTWFAITQDAPSLNAPGILPRTDLLPLAAACVLGFTFCPYLDLTFHRARQLTAPVAGMSAFAIGFGVMFFLMICFTLWYAKVMEPGTWGQIDRVVAWLIASHLMLQCAYTVSVHFREVSKELNASDLPARGGTIIGLIAGAMPLLLSGFVRSPLPLADPRELTYRLFMSFYALVFPAYVWICMTPVPKAERTSATRSQFVAFLVAVALAAPFYWMAFIHRQMQWLLVGVGIVILCRIVLAIGRRRSVAL